MSGLASGFRVIDCVIAPAAPSANPKHSPTTARGSLPSMTICSIVLPCPSRIGRIRSPGSRPCPRDDRIDDERRSERRQHRAADDHARPHHPPDRTEAHTPAAAVGHERDGGRVGGAHSAITRRRLTSASSTGTLTIAIEMPTGNRVPPTESRPTTSATSSSTPPSTPEIGTSQR